MKIQITQPEDTGPLKVSGTLDIYAADTLHQALIQYHASQSTIALDLSEVTSFDTFAVQLLCSSRKSAEQANKPFTILSPPPALSQICVALGLGPQEL